VRRDTKIAGTILGIVPLFVLAMSLLCTWAVAHGASPRLRVLFRFMCHGIERRCLVLWGVPMPICARCTAIWGGISIGMLLFALLARFIRIRERVARFILIAATLPLAIDGFTQLFGLRESVNSLRVATGALCGIALGLWALAAIDEPPHARSHLGGTLDSISADTQQQSTGTMS
jgi:uncharacterized membrane protein